MIVLSRKGAKTQREYMEKYLVVTSFETEALSVRACCSNAIAIITVIPSEVEESDD